MSSKPFNQGRISALSSASEKANPYAHGSQEADEWVRGFAASISHEGSATEGMDACRRGIAREVCPYELDSDQREEWLTGWDEASRYNSIHQMKDTR